jgi:flagellar basal body-associated protein FliL
MTLLLIFLFVLLFSCLLGSISSFFRRVDFEQENELKHHQLQPNVIVQQINTNTNGTNQQGQDQQQIKQQLMEVTNLTNNSNIQPILVYFTSIYTD